MVSLDVTREAIAGPEEVRRLQGLGRVGEVAAELVTFCAGVYRGGTVTAACPYTTRSPSRWW